MNENCFSNFCEFRLISEGVASAPTVYSFLKNETKVFLTFVPLSFPTFSQVLFSIGFYQEKSIRNKPNKLEIFLLGML